MFFPVKSENEHETLNCTTSDATNDGDDTEKKEKKINEKFSFDYVTSNRSIKILLSYLVSNLRSENLINDSVVVVALQLSSFKIFYTLTQKWIRSLKKNKSFQNFQVFVKVHVLNSS